MKARCLKDLQNLDLRNGQILLKFVSSDQPNGVEFCFHLLKSIIWVSVFEIHNKQWLLCFHANVYQGQKVNNSHEVWKFDAVSV